MKSEIPIIFAFLIAPIASWGTSMCVHTNSYVAQLSIYDDGVSHTTGENGAWVVTTAYNTSSFNTPVIKGYAACTEVGAENTVSTADTTVGITGGESTGPYCWCVMNKPLVSYPVLAYKDYADIAACSAGCADKCGTLIQTSQSFRTAMFESIW